MAGMAGPAATGLARDSDPGQFVLHIDRLNGQVYELQQQLLKLTTSQDDRKKKDVSETKAFEKVPHFNGDEKMFGDFEFKLQNCLRPYKHFEEFLDWIKNADEEPDLDILRKKAYAEAQHDPSVDLHWYDEQLYNILSLLLTDTPLQTVKNAREDTGIRGCRSWYAITREVAGKSGVRLERLADRVHHPKPILTYKEGLARLTEWENDLKDLAKIEGQQVSEITKRTILKAMIPADFARDLERDRALKPWDEAWKFVLEQMPLRKEWKGSTKKSRGPDDMDVDVAEETKDEPGDDPMCAPCDGELDTLKGGARPFQGYCSHCWIWGHMKKDCRKLDAEMAKTRNKGQEGGAKGEGKGKGKEKGGTNWQSKGGWQVKGGGKGKGNWGKGKGKGGVVYNIDGGYFSGWGSGQWDSYGDRWIFGLEDEGDDGVSDGEGNDSADEEGQFLTEPLQKPVYKTFAELQAAYADKSSPTGEAAGPAEVPRVPKALSLSMPPTWADDGGWSTPSANTAAATMSPPTGSSTTALSYYFGTTAHLGNEEMLGPCSDLLGEEQENTEDDYEIEVPTVHDLVAETQERELLSIGCTDFSGCELVDVDLSCIERHEPNFGMFLALLYRKRGLIRRTVAPVQIADIPSLDVEEDDEEPDHGLVDGDSEDENADYCNLSAKHRAQRDRREAMQKAKLGYAARPLVEDDDSDLEGILPADGSTGTSPPVLMMPGSEEEKDHDASGQPPEAKPTSSVRVGGSRLKGSKGQWRNRRTRSRMDLATGEVTKCDAGKVQDKDFEEMTVGELRQMAEQQCGTMDPDAMELNWMDFPEVNVCYEDEEDKPAEILGFSWRSDPTEWEQRKWVKVESVVDSGASAPVAPPSMLPNVKIEESEGSKRGQKYISASKHKLKNPGQQQVHACTEDGDPTDLLFQIADVSKPLVSVSAICERGNRVIFGRAGGVVQNLRSGKQVPFYRRNGIYVLSLWLQDGSDEPFGRR